MILFGFCKDPPTPPPPTKKQKTKNKLLLFDLIYTIISIENLLSNNNELLTYVLKGKKMRKDVSYDS